MSTRKRDDPVDAEQVDQDEDIADCRREVELSDIFELRNCHYCDDFLPLDRAAKTLELGEDEDEEFVPVCDGCFQLHG